MDVTYSREEWDAALEAAEIADWDPIDAGEQHGPLAQWICDQAIDHEKVGRDVGIIEAAITALEARDETEFSPERLIDVLNSYRGETVDDWRTLAEEYAEEVGVELVFIDSEPSEEDYEKWYTERATNEGEVCAPISAGGTLHWFDSNKW